MSDMGLERLVCRQPFEEYKSLALHRTGDLLFLLARSRRGLGVLDLILVDLEILRECHCEEIGPEYDRLSFGTPAWPKWHLCSGGDPFE